MTTQQQLRFVLTGDAAALDSAFQRARQAADQLNASLKPGNEQLRQLDRNAAAMTGTMDKLRAGAAALAPLMGGLFTVAGITSWVTGTAEAAAQIERLSQLAGSSAEEFQRYAAGAKSAGMDIEKFADVMKDVQDKVGDFLATGGGELKDFFEKIAPKVGVTADQFRNLSGPQALQLFYSTLEKANVGQKEMVFFLESIADDAATLQPLLRGNGAGFAELAAKAQAAGAIMSDKVVKDGVELNKQLKEMRQNVDGLSNDIASSLVPALNKMFATAKENGGGMAGLMALFGFDKKFTAAQELAAAGDEVIKLDRRLKLLQSDFRNGVGFFGGKDKVAAEIREVTAQLDAAKARFREMDSARNNAAAANNRTLLNQADASLRGTSTGKPWQPPPEKKPSTEAEKYLQQLQQQADKLLDLTDLNQALKDVEAGRMEGLTPALKARILDQAAANDETRMALFLQEQLTAQRERDAKLPMGPELPPDIEARLKRLNELMADTPTAKLEEARKDMLLLADAFETGKISAEQFTEAAQARLGTLPDQFKQLETVFDDLRNSIEGWGRDSAAAMVDFAMTGKTSFGDMATSILADMARMATYRLIMQPLFNSFTSFLPTSFGGGGGAVSGGSINATQAMANGGAFDAGVQAFANGGAFTNSIVSSPTLFKFAQGTGLMGEAGPEAIMPLRRDASGRLGVSAAGAGGGGNVHVEIKNYSGAQVQQRSVPDGRGGRRIEVTIGELVANEMRRPGSSMNNAGREAYGLGPALVRR